MGVKKPVIAITMGDAAGLGPEIGVKALGKKKIHRACRPLVIGDARILSGTARFLNSPLEIRAVASVEDVKGIYGAIDVLDMKNLDRKDFTPGQLCVPCGRAAMKYVEAAARIALSGKVDAVVTAPINKEATRQAGYGDVWHLEYFARIARAKEYATMLVSGKLRGVHL